MSYKDGNPGGGYAVATSPRQGHLSLTQRAENTTGRFDCWLETTSGKHRAVVAQASAVMRAHQRVSKAGDALNRRTH